MILLLDFEAETGFGFSLMRVNRKSKRGGNLMSPQFKSWLQILAIIAVLFYGASTLEKWWAAGPVLCSYHLEMKNCADAARAYREKAQAANKKGKYSLAEDHIRTAKDYEKKLARLMGHD